MGTTGDRITERLLSLGFTQELVDASMPDWWTPEDYESPSTQALVSMLLARRLSLDPSTLLDDSVPVGFLHTGPTKFKHMRLGEGERRDALVAFAQGVSRTLFSAVSPSPAPLPEDPLVLRRLLMHKRPFVSFGDVLTASWSLGIPVLHLRLFPAKTKGVTAIATRIGTRHAILVARETGFDAQYMFHIAHELGHIALGHLRDVAAIVDADPSDLDNRPDELVDDDEERAADAYAQALLTGNENYQVVRDTIDTRATRQGTADELARRALQSAHALQVDPGHIVMCFGHSTGEWALATAAAKLLPNQSEKPGTLVNRVLWRALDISDVESQVLAFLRAVATI